MSNFYLFTTIYYIHTINCIASYYIAPAFKNHHRLFNCCWSSLFSGKSLFLKAEIMLARTVVHFSEVAHCTLLCILVERTCIFDRPTSLICTRTIHINKLLAKRAPQNPKQPELLPRLWASLHKLIVRPHCFKQHLDNSYYTRNLSWCLPRAFTTIYQCSGYWKSLCTLLEERNKYQPRYISWNLQW